ncbi:MAG: tetratricopeptide repeat protein [Proteobacteria bacterium]|nr:tetratricopeptide repeat protein [Pseudomonadota bacterium]
MLKALRNALGFGRAAESKVQVHNAPAQPTVTPRPDHFRLGNAAVQAEDYDEAATHYARSVAQEPDRASGYIGLGYALLQLGRLSESIAALGNAVAREPRNSDGYFMLGQAHLRMGAPEAALQAWSRTHALAPELEPLYCEYCLLLFNQGQPEKARALIEEGIQRFPGNGDFKFYLGNLLAERADYAGAAAVYGEAVALSPESPHLLSSYATALMQTGGQDAAADVLKKAIALAPEDAGIFSNYLLCVQYGTRLSKEEKFRVAQEFSERFESPLMGEWGRYSRDASYPERKLRVGYVSGDFRNHSLANFIEPILTHHDKSRFEIFCYYSHPVADEVTLRIAKLADQWTPCHGVSDADLAARIRSDGIDVLIDLSGHTGHNRLLTFARKPAPVQMTWLGYQATTGLRAMDYRITEESLDPTGTTEQYHSEKLLRLPASGTFSPSPESPLVNELPAHSGKPFTFGCLNNPTKITDDAISVWAKILVQCPDARLMLGNATPPLIERLSEEFLRNGASADQLLFKPKVGLADYLRLHHEIDLALDTFPYNGGTTSFHSLWMGVPPITLDGDTALSKVGAGLMRGLNLHQFCATTKEQYVAQAVYFYGHQNELSKVRASLRDQFSAVLTQLAVDVTAWQEAALEACWNEYCARTTPALDGPAA